MSVNFQTSHKTQPSDLEEDEWVQVENEPIIEQKVSKVRAIILRSEDETAPPINDILVFALQPKPISLSTLIDGGISTAKNVGKGLGEIRKKTVATGNFASRLIFGPPKKK